MSKIPPEIAKKIAAMAKPPAPGAPRPAPGVPVAKAPAAKAPAAKPAAPPMGLLPKVAIAGWAVGLLAGGAAYYFYSSAAADKQAALAEQAATYDAQITQLKAAAAAELKQQQDTAAAQQQVLQTELDFQKMPEIPLETTFRANQVLFVSNGSKDAFTCKVRLFRPIGAVSREVEFSMKGGGYQDMAAIDTWLFAKGDKVEFVKSGYKPRSLVVP